MPFYFIDADVKDSTKYKMEWKVKLPVLIEALRAGCQFCCYVAIRLLSLSHIRHNSQFIGSDGVRCCAKGTITEKSEQIEKVIHNLQTKLEWQVEPEDRMIIFECAPLDQDVSHSHA